jgi:hypothetical protein
MIKSRLAAAAVGLVAAGSVLSVAGPALATTPPTPPPACPATAPTTPPLYTAKCTITPAAASDNAALGSTQVTLPGVGSLYFTLTSTGTIDLTKGVTGLGATGTGFVPVVTKVSPGGTSASVTFVSPATGTTKKQVYTIQVKLTPSSGTTAAKIVAVGGPGHGHHHHGGDEGGHGAWSGAGGAGGVKPFAALGGGEDGSGGGRR